MPHLYTLGAIATSPQLTTLAHSSSTHAQWVDWWHMAFVAMGLLCFLMVIVWLVPLLIKGVWYGITESKGNVTDEEVAQALQGGCEHGYPPQLQMCNRGQKRCVVCKLNDLRAKLDRDVASLSATRAILADILAHRRCDDYADGATMTEKGDDE